MALQKNQNIPNNQEWVASNEFLHKCTQNDGRHYNENYLCTMAEII